MKNIYIASCTENGGIYRCGLDESGHIALLDKTELDRPMYMAAENGRLYAVLRSPFNGSEESGVCSLKIGADGALDDIKHHGSTMGKVACHILIDGEDIYCANYISGSIARLGKELIVHKGKSVHPTRQEAPHTHFVGLTPDKKYICAADLGLDTVFVYNKDLTLKSRASVPLGHGARHIIFSPDGRYMFCANELASTVSAFAYADGKLTLLDTKSVLPDNTESTAAAIRYYDGRIYVSNRGHDSVSELTFDGKALALQKCIPTLGKNPRDFDFTSGFMLCTNEGSDSVTVFDTKNDFQHIQTVEIPRPLNVIGGKNV